MRTAIQSISERSSTLFYTGIIHLFLAVVFAALTGIDSREINGESVWLKPFRFAISIFLFTWTYAWFTGYVKQQIALIRSLNFLIAACMFTEIVLISIQAGRGVASHFNFSSSFDASVYAAMGAAIGFNAVLLVIWFVVYLFYEKGGGIYRQSIIWGMLLFLLGNFSGYLLVRYGFTVHLEEARDTLPLTGWKASLKDLRISHAIGLHAIQILPLAMWAIKKTKARPAFIHRAGILYASLYVLAVLYAFI